MRLKQLDFCNSKITYEKEQENALSEMSENVNNIGNLFDKFCEVENFVLDRIKIRLNELIETRENRTKIEKESGTKEYLEMFKNNSDKLINRIDEAIKEWDELSDKSISDIIQSIEDLKSISEMLKKIKNFNSLNTVNNLLNLVDEFGRFKLIKIVTTKDIREKINLLIQIKSNLIIKNENNKKISIDDL